MTNDIIAMASKWEEERLPPQNVTRKMTHRFGLHLSTSCWLYQRNKHQIRRQSLPTKDHNWPNTNKLQAPYCKQYKNANRRRVKTSQALCTLWLPWETQQMHGLVCFAKNDKKSNFALNHHLVYGHCGIYLVTLWYVITNMLAKQ